MKLTTCALLDGGATVTLVDAKFARKVGLTVKPCIVSIRGLYGEEERLKCKRTRFTVRGAFGEQKIEHALIVPSLSLPRQSLTSDLAKRIEKCENIKLYPYRDAQLCILIGQDNWPLLMCDESRRLENSGLVVSQTRLGWSVHGYVEEEEGAAHSHGNGAAATVVSGYELTELAELNRTVSQYLEIENLGVIKTAAPTDRNERARAILEITTRRKENGWETGLLWKSGCMPKVDSQATALKRLYSLERKLDKNPSFAERYYKEMDRLIEKGYAVKVSGDVKRPREWYVPHFGVENANKPGKVRLVFDAAARTEGVALNDLLETGPDLLKSLLGVLLRFRQFPIAVKADIQDMYLRIKMIERDRGAQRFLYRGANRQRAPDVYENTSLIFGSASSPCSAIYVKNKNAERYANSKPAAVKSIIENCYMDDYLASGKTLAEMRERVCDVTTINREANFHLHKWASNDPRAIAEVNEAQKLENEQQASLGNAEERTLGLYWDRDGDTLSFNVGLNKIPEAIWRGKRKPTKRELFSIAMSVYDPLGLIAPFTLQAKLVMQDIWRTGVNWDSVIRDDELKAWTTWMGNLSTMKQCKVPRCYLYKSSEYANSQLHVFCDASLKAYAAVVYLRSETPNGTIYVSIVMSKSRVASKKPQTVPRLELQAALLGTRTAEIVMQELEIKIDERVFWSDSTTVLHWIRGEPRTKQTFVANRLGEIGEMTKAVEWRWVPTKSNPADDATRASDRAMQSSDRWFSGPEFLLQPLDVWPKEKALQSREIKEINELESRREYIGSAFHKSPETSELPVSIAILGWRRIRKTMERVRKFFTIWYQRTIQKVERNQRGRVKRSTSLRTSGVSPAASAHEAENAWFRTIQAACFPAELEALRKGKDMPRGSKLIGVKPLIDGSGLLRARGRLSKFCSTLFQNKPIILDAAHFATKLLIAEFHRRFDHANNESVVNELRQQFYIVGLRTRLRFLAKNCLLCRLRRAKPANPPMADLPACRLAYRERPFTHCGVDYFGPMHVKVGRRREKRWGALFTCMSTRAVHLEVAHTLDAGSAIMAVQRLAGRRGFPREIYSDNGTNFVKANKELRIAIAGMDAQKQREFADANRFQWHFNPPDAAHMGGAWERLVRSIKVALNHTLSEKAPTDEALTTLFVEVEHMVNSRPLTHVSVDPGDEEALTPNHFLLGSSSGYPRYEKYESETFDPRKNFEIAQHLANGFWKRWLREYLPTLLPRQKWNKPVAELKVGDIVLIVDYQMPRNQWRKGKVIEVFPNRDDNVLRVVKVRTGKKDFIRPVNKLVRIFSDTA